MVQLSKIYIWIIFVSAFCNVPICAITRKQLGEWLQTNRCAKKQKRTEQCCKCGQAWRTITIDLYRLTKSLPLPYPGLCCRGDECKSLIEGSWPVPMVPVRRDNPFKLVRMDVSCSLSIRWMADRIILKQTANKAHARPTLPYFHTIWASLCRTKRKQFDCCSSRLKI